MLCGMGSHPSSVRLRFRHIRNYTCYYGADRLDDVAKFDAAILEAQQHDPATLRRLSASGTIVIGYLSVGQTDQLERGDGKGPGGYASWYLDRLTESNGKLVPGSDGQPDRDPEWHTYWVNPASPAWQAQLMRRAKQLLKQQGCDGLFLDTILFDGAYGDEFLDTTITRGIVGLAKRMRGNFPQAVLIANNGWAYLKALGPIVDGIMYEEFTADFHAADAAARNESDNQAYAINEFRRSQKKLPLVVLALDYAEPENVELITDAKARATRFDFLESFSTKNLEGIELYVLSTVNPAQQLIAKRQGDTVTLTWQANRLHLREAGVDRFVLKRSDLSITTDEDWEAARVVNDQIDPLHPFYVDEHVPESAHWYALGAIHKSGIPLVGRITARVIPADPEPSP